MHWSPWKFVSVLILTAGLAPAAAPDLSEARKLYHSTEFERSLRVLQAVPDKTAEVWELIGLNFYMQTQYKKSTDALEKAGALEPANAEIALWLGRAWGRRAETSMPLTAFVYAIRTRQYFEKSVRLNPGSLEAQSDLLEYYIEAPGFLGGGFDKAEATAAKIGTINPAEGQWAEAHIADYRKDAGGAESHFRRAVELAPHEVGRVLDLARFLARQGRYKEADENFEHARQLEPNSPKVVFAEAESYVKARRNLESARELLKRYMSMNLNAEDTPRSEAAKLLREAQGG